MSIGVIGGPRSVAHGACRQVGSINNPVGSASHGEAMTETSAVTRLSETLAKFARHDTGSPPPECRANLRRAVNEAVDELRRNGVSSATIQFEIASLTAAHIDPVAYRNIVEQMTAWCLARFSDESGYLS